MDSAPLSRNFGRSAISATLARSTACILAALLVWAGIANFGLLSFRPSLATLARLVAGVGILFARSWGYYLAYLVTLSTLWLPLRTSFVPFSQPISRALWLYAGFDREFTFAIFNLIIAASLGWTHYILHRDGRLDQPVNAPTRRRIVRACQILSGITFALPVILFVYAAISDPPGSNPGGFGGGEKAFFILILGWPFVLVGLIGLIITRRLLQKLPKSDTSNTTAPPG
jgi:hypothetical protein